MSVPDSRFAGVHYMPAGFNWSSTLPKVKAYHIGEYFSCNIRPEDLIDYSIYTQTIFVDKSGGNDANNGLSWANRKASIGNARRVASASGIPTRILVYTDKGRLVYQRAKSFADDSSTAVSNVPIIIETMDGRCKTGPFDDLTWAKTAGYVNVYDTTRSNALRAFNPQLPDFIGSNVEKEYVYINAGNLAASITAVDAQEGSWTVDGATNKVYAHAHGHDVVSDATIRLTLSTPGIEWNCNKDLFLRGFDFYGGVGGNLKAFGGSTNNIVVDDCNFYYAASGNTYNGSSSVIDSAQILGCQLFAAFNSSFKYASKDGINLHAENSVIPSGLIVNCVGQFNGLTPSQSNNGFTTHDGIKSISIGSTYTHNRGTNSGHVSDDTQVWCVGDKAGHSAGDLPTGGGINYGGFGVWSGGAKIWLDSCVDVGVEIGVYGGSGNAQAYIKNHRGTGKRAGNIKDYK